MLCTFHQTHRKLLLFLEGCVPFHFVVTACSLICMTEKRRYPFWFSFVCNCYLKFVSLSSQYNICVLSLFMEYFVYLEGFTHPITYSPKIQIRKTTSTLSASVLSAYTRHWYAGYNKKKIQKHQKIICPHSQVLSIR